MNNPKITLLAPALAAVAFASVASAQTVLLSDDFSTNTASSYVSGGFANAGTTGSGATQGSFNVGSGALNFTSPSFATVGGTGAFGYFNVGRSFTSALPTLTTGQSITLSATFSFTQVNTSSGNSIYFGLVDREALAATGNYGGFGVRLNPNGGSFRHVTISDAGTNGQVFGGNDTTLGNTSTNFGPGTIALSTPYTWSITVTKLAATNDYSIQSTFNTSTTVASTFTNANAGDLDGFALVWNAAVAGNSTQLSIDNLQVTTTAVPEPSAFAALAGLAGLGLAATRRRR